MKTKSRKDAETARAVAWTIQGGFSVAAAERTVDGEVTLYAVTDPYGVTIRLTPDQLRRQMKLYQ